MKYVIGSIVLLALIAFGYWTITPLFITTEVNDTIPGLDDALVTTDDMMFDETRSDEITTVPNELPESNTDAFTSGLAEETNAPTETPKIVTSEAFPIIDTLGHAATGDVRVIHTPTDGSFVRYENYDGTNGPDLFVYLANNLDADDFVSLGRAKGNRGNINYKIPEDVDIDEYKYVMTWCRAFGVLFDYAEIK